MEFINKSSMTWMGLYTAPFRTTQVLPPMISLSLQGTLARILPATPAVR